MTATRSDRAPRVRRECEHVNVRHAHGTRLAYKLDACRCEECTQAAVLESRRRRLDRAMGAPARRVPAAPLRAHVVELGAAGVGFRRVAELAGVSASTVQKILAEGELPGRRVARSTAEKVLRVRPGLDAVSDGGVLDATGTIRRMHALHARGWSRHAIADRLGVEDYSLTWIERSGRVTGRMARKIRDLYEQLWDQAPPAATQQERAGITMTLRRAREHGWAPPAAWDDDIDDPKARPHGVRPDAWEVVA